MFALTSYVGWTGVIAAIITSLGYVANAVIGRRNYRILKGNGRGDVSQMVEHLVLKTEDIGLHLILQDQDMALLKNRMDTWERTGVVGSTPNATVVIPGVQDTHGSS